MEGSASGTGRARAAQAGWWSGGVGERDGEARVVRARRVLLISVCVLIFFSPVIRNRYEISSILTKEQPNPSAAYKFSVNATFFKEEMVTHGDHISAIKDTEGCQKSAL